MAKKDYTTNAAYEELLRADPFGMFNECGLDGVMVTSMLVLARRLAESLRDNDGPPDDDAVDQEHLVNQINAIEVINEMMLQRFHAAEQILHAAHIPNKFTGASLV